MRDYVDREMNIFDRSIEKKGQDALNEFKDILNQDNFVFLHGTSIDSAEKIFESGLNVNRTTTVSCSPKDNPFKLASYSWKDIKPKQSVGIVVEIPMKEICSKIYDDNFSIDSWLSNLRSNNFEESILMSLSNQQENNNPLRGFVVPEYFIRGATQLKNRQDYMESADESNISKISFYENPNYFSNLPKDKQGEIITKIKEKIKN